MQFDRQIMQERILDRIMADPNSGCWLWEKYLTPKGYGVIGVGSETALAYRVSYIAFNGAIPDGLQLDHKCRVRACVNPSHLEPVTCKENVRRGLSGKFNATKTHCPKGHAYAGANLYLHAKTGSRKCLTCLYENRWKRTGAKRRIKEN